MVEKLYLFRKQDYYRSQGNDVKNRMFDSFDPQALNTNAKEFMPACMSQVKKAVVDDPSILSRYQKKSQSNVLDEPRMQEIELKRNHSNSQVAYWIYWSKNLFTYILQFFEPSHRILK